MVTELTDANFDQILSTSTVPVIVDFWAPWCTPCRMLGPMLEKAAAERLGKVLVGKLDVDTSPKTADRFNVHSIPTLIAFRGGKTTGMQSELLPPDQLGAWIDRMIATSGG